MRIGFKYVHFCILLVFLIEEAVTLKKEWSYFGDNSIRSENHNDHVASKGLHRKQDIFNNGTDDVDFNAIPDKSNNAELDNGRTSSRKPNDDADGALLILDEKAENEITEAKDDNEKTTKSDKSKFEDARIVIDDPDSEPTAAPDEKSGTGYKKYNAEKIATEGNMAMSWPLGIIPYYFDMNSYDHILASRVREVMDFLEGASCVQFKSLIVKPKEKHNWIHITNPNLQRECMHRGMHQENGEIRMVLGLDCLKRRDILHTLFHAMGFMDEVSHPHRDQFIRVMWNNIQPRYQSLYSIAGGNTMPVVEYDPMSIMHFHDRAFSKNGHATVVPLMPGLQIQPSDKLSQLDKMKLRLAFGHECNRRTVDNLLDTCKSVLHGEEQKKKIMDGRKMQKLKGSQQLDDSFSRSEYEDDPETKSSTEKNVGGDNQRTGFYYWE